MVDLALLVGVGAVCFAAWRLGRFLFADADQALLSLGNHNSNAFTGKVVWITGASQGLGLYLASHFASCGAKVIISARNMDNLEAAKKSIPSDDVLVLPFDLCGSDSELEKAALAADSAFSGSGIDYLIHNAGASQHAMAEEVQSSVVDQMFALNTIGPIKLTQAVLPYLLKRGKGRLVVIASMAAKVPTPGQAVYSATKFAVLGYFASLATEICDRGVGVTVCCPGPVSSGSDVPVTRSVFGPSGMITRTEEPKAKGKTNPKRYAQLVANAAAHGVDECWIAKHPVLAVAHIQQYIPRLGYALLKKIGPKRARAVSTGKSGYDWPKP